MYLTCVCVWVSLCVRDKDKHSSCNFDVEHISYLLVFYSPADLAHGVLHPDKLVKLIKMIFTCSLVF